MSGATAMEEPLGRFGEVLSDNGYGLLAGAILTGVAGLLVAPPPFDLAALAVGASLAALATIGRGVAALAAHARRRARALGQFLETDPVPSFLADGDGTLFHANPAARHLAGREGPPTLAGALGRFFANPSSAVFRLQQAAASSGSARGEIALRGTAVRLTVVRHRGNVFLWRIEEQPVAAGAAEDAAGALPMLAFSPTGTILGVNEAMRDLLGGTMPRHLDRIVADLPLRSGAVHPVATASGTRHRRVCLVEAGEGRSLAYLLPEDFAPGTGCPAAQAGMEDLPVGLVRIRRDGCIAAANRIARGLLAGDDGADLVGAAMSDRLEGLGRPVRDWLDDALHGRGLGRPEVLRVRGEGSERYLQVTLGRAARPGEAGLVAVLNDATELKTLEAQFVQSQKMQAIGQLAGGVAHDFNNLLTAISGHCDLMLLRHDPGDPDYGDLVQVHQNANRAASLVGQLLAFSRKQTLQPQVIDLRDTLSELTHLLNRLVGERIVLSFVHEYGLPPIRADKRQLEQVIMNLVVNARDAMPKGGQIRVETATRLLRADLERDRATVPAGRYVVVKVEDQGTGIAPDKLAKIFEPFYTTKRTGEGTGLGLSTAYGIVKQSGGFIFVDSVLNRGTEFTLYFPAYDGPLEPPAPAPPRVERRRTAPTGPLLLTAPVRPGEARRATPRTEAPQGRATPKPGAAPARPSRPPVRPAAGGGVILLVEDEAPVRAFASRALRMRGYTVIEAENAEEALDTLQDPDLAIDLFVTDVIMPGMDGPTWVRRALEDRPGVKVVFVSGYAEDSFADEKLRIPNSVFLPKPFSLNELTATVQDQLT